MLFPRAATCRMACWRETSAAVWAAFAAGLGSRRYFRSSDSSAAIAAAACSYASAVRTSRALALAAWLVTREPIVTTQMSATSPRPAPVIAHRFHDRETGLLAAPGMEPRLLTRPRPPGWPLDCLGFVC